MVKVVFPDEGSKFYILYRDFLIGPVDQTGRRPSISSSVEIQSLFDGFKQGKGSLWGEKDVIHQKTDGCITFQPISGSIRFFHAPREPYLAEATLLRSNGSPAKLYAHRGLYVDNSSRIIWKTDDSITHVCMTSLGSNAYEFTYIFCENRRNIWRVVSWERQRVVFRSMNRPEELLATITTGTIALSASLPNNVDWTAEQPYSVIHDFIEETSIIWHVPRDLTFPYYATNSIAWANAKKFVDMATVQLDRMASIILIPPDIHYGDLAMTASQKVVLNKVNMLEFLRDAIHPTELIPKLTNFASLFSKNKRALRKLKDVSGEYLRLQFGILPTASDLRQIVDAFSAWKPYFDSNGFSTVTAFHNRNASHDNYSRVVTQRIKLAIDKEDQGLQLLFQQLENIGVLPTFENVWDLIPYSFLVDWFIDVGGYLQRVDTQKRIHRLNIRYVTMSHKDVITQKLSEVSRESPFTGELSLVRYRRWSDDHCPVPPVSLQVPTTPFNRWLEGTALIIQQQ